MSFREQAHLGTSKANPIEDEFNITNVLRETNFIEKLNAIHMQRKQAIKHRVNYQNNVVKDHYLGDVPLSVVFKYLMDKKTKCSELGKGKTFFASLLDIRNDYNLRFEDQDYENIPEFFNSLDYSKDLLFSDPNAENLNQFLEDIKTWTKSYEFHYKFTHPCKKVFLGPDKLDIHDHYNVIFISPLCLVLETSSTCSGFMLMDTFINVNQIIFESEISYDERLKRFTFNTKVSINQAIDFIKSNLFKGKVESEGIKEFTTLVNDLILPSYKKILTNQSNLFYSSLLTENNPSPKAPASYMNIDSGIFAMLDIVFERLDNLETRLEIIEKSA